MAAGDWIILDDGLDSASVARGVTTSPSPPNGGGSFIYGFNSKVDTDGAVGWRLDPTENPNHAPAAEGASVRGALMRGVSSSKTGFSPVLFAGMQGSSPPSVLDQAYIIGLEDADPYRIVVVKGQVINGIPAATTENSLLRSTSTYTIPSGGRWHHLRMDVIVQGTGDVLIQCFESDLTVNPVTSPVWSPIAGCEEFTDDVLGVGSGSAPFTDGWMGFAFSTSQQARRGYFDQLEMIRQI